jgi:tripartite-type tricarboxylate transporter receptor subunit TctC
MKSPRDGYTLLLAGGSMAGARYANANVTYDVLRDFTPVSLIATSVFALAANPALLFNSMAGIDVVQVPYKASPEVVTDLIAGRVDYYITGLTSFLPVKDKLKILAVTTSARSELLPEVPTMAQAALPGYDMPT